MLVINNNDVMTLLDMADCIKVQEASFLGIDDGSSVHRPRIDMYVPCEREDGYWRWGTMEGATSVPGPYFAIRMKSDVITWSSDELSGLEREDKYCVNPGTYCGLIMVFSTRNGEPLAFINDGHLQHMRVGGGAGLGAKYLARKDADKVGIIGSGGMARTYLDAFCKVRDIKEVKVYSPNPDNRKLYAKEMKKLHGISVIAVDSPEAAVDGVDILATCTSSMVPTVKKEWLMPGMHIVNLSPFELTEDIFEKADIVIRQGVAGAVAGNGDDDPRIKSGIGNSPLAYIAGSESEMQRLPAEQHQTLFRRDFPDFNDLAHGRISGRTNDEQITAYINAGNQGLQFAAVSGLVYEAALARQLGKQLPTEWFLQDIRD